MYPKTSNFQSSDSGAAWVFVGTPTDSPQVLVTQWDAILRNLQKRLILLLPPTWSFNMQTATPGQGTPRATADIVVNGMWDQITSEGFMYLAACTASSDGPQNLNAIVSVLPTSASGTFSEALTRAIILIAFFLNVVGTPSAPANLDDDKTFATAAAGFAIPGGAILPSTSVPVQSLAPDRSWFAIYRPVQDPTPVPPSIATAATGALGVISKLPSQSSGASPWLWAGAAFIGGVLVHKALSSRDERRAPRGRR